MEFYNGPPTWITCDMYIITRQIHHCDELGNLDYVCSRFIVKNIFDDSDMESKFDTAERALRFATAAAKAHAELELTD